MRARSCLVLTASTVGALGLSQLFNPAAGYPQPILPARQPAERMAIPPADGDTIRGELVEVSAQPAGDLDRLRLREPNGAEWDLGVGDELHWSPSG